MKGYTCIPASEDRPARIIMEHIPARDDGPHVKLPSPNGLQFSWGTKTNETGATALAILRDHFNGDEKRAAALHRRFMWRALVDGVSPTSTFHIDSDKIATIIDQIEEVAEVTAPDVRSMAAAPPPVQSEAGIGPGGSVIEWDKDRPNTLKPNEPLKVKK